MTAWSQEAQANAFFKTLRESLVEFDERLTDLERLGGLVHKSLVAVEKRLDELDARFDESPREAAQRREMQRRIGEAAIRENRALAGIHDEAENDDFLAPPLPWWARSPKVG